MADAVSRERLEQAIAGSFFRTILEGEILHFGGGRCDLQFVPKPVHRQFLGAVHGGLLGALADDACAWACASSAGDLVTAAYTLNFLAPAMGERIIARGSALKLGRRIAVGRADVLSVAADGTETLVAVLQGTNGLI